MAVAAAAIAGYAILEEHELWRRAFAELALIALERVLLPKSRDGGTGRRSGLKIRRSLRSWGFDPPSRHQQNKKLRLNWPLEIEEAKIVWWLF